MTENEIYETVKEYSLFVDGLEFEIHARISKKVKPNGDSDFEWKISHYCKPSESAGGAYIPSLQTGNTFEETQNLLFGYLKSFTSIGVISNNYY